MNLLKALIVGLLSSALYWWLSSVVGGPLITPDSLIYRNQAVHPWRSFGAYYPTGFSWTLYLGSLFDLEQRTTLALLSGLKATLMYLLLRRFYSSVSALMLLVPLLLMPELLQLDLSVWSEITFLILIIALALLLSKPNYKLRYLLLSLVFVIALAETRHAAIFFLPGLAVAIGCFRASARGFWSTLCSIVLVSTLLGMTWGGLHLLKTVLPQQPSIANNTNPYANPTLQRCKHYLASFDALRYCRAKLPLVICRERESSKFLSMHAQDIQRLHHDPESPLNNPQLTESDLCGDWAQVKSWIVSERRKALLQLLWKRFLEQLSPWYTSEVGLAEASGASEQQRTKLEQYVIASNSVTWAIGTIGLALCLVHVVLSGYRSNPVVLFLLLGGLGHALGIAITNPFPVLRYIFVPRFLFILGGVIAIGAEMRGRERLKPQDQSPFRAG